MKGYHYPDAVLKGIAHLDEHYPEWWRDIAAEGIDMYDPFMHILATVQGKLVYETKEIIFWDRNELVDHGFMPHWGVGHMVALTNEWAFQVRKIQKERK